MASVLGSVPFSAGSITLEEAGSHVVSGLSGEAHRTSK